MFRKKMDLIPSEWLLERGIPDQYRDAFNFSKRKLRKELAHLESATAGLQEQVNKFDQGQHQARVELQLKKERVRDMAEKSGESGLKQTGIEGDVTDLHRLAAALDDEQASRAEMMNKISNNEKTIWLLRGITDKQFRYPSELI